MSPDVLPAAIERVMMLAAGPLDTDAEEEALGDALDAFGTVLEFRCLAYAVAARTAEKIPEHAAVALTSLSDLAALALLSDGANPHRLHHLLETLPTPLLPTVATSLLGMWRNACSLAAIEALADLQIPDHAPSEGGTR